MIFVFLLKSGLIMRVSVRSHLCEIAAEIGICTIACFINEDIKSLDANQVHLLLLPLDLAPQKKWKRQLWRDEFGLAVLKVIFNAIIAALNPQVLYGRLFFLQYFCLVCCMWQCVVIGCENICRGGWIGLCRVFFKFFWRLRGWNVFTDGPEAADVHAT